MDVTEPKSYNKHKLKVYAYIKAKRLIRKADKGFSSGKKFGGMEAQMMARNNKIARDEAEEEEKERKVQHRWDRLEKNKTWRERRESDIRKVPTKEETLARLFSCTHCRSELSLVRQVWQCGLGHPVCGPCAGRVELPESETETEEETDGEDSQEDGEEEEEGAVGELATVQDGGYGSDSNSGELAERQFEDPAYAFTFDRYKFEREETISYKQSYINKVNRQRDGKLYFDNQPKEIVEVEEPFYKKPYELGPYDDDDDDGSEPESENPLVVRKGSQFDLEYVNRGRIFRPPSIELDEHGRDPAYDFDFDRYQFDIADTMSYKKTFLEKLNQVSEVPSTSSSFEELPGYEEALKQSLYHFERTNDSSLLRSFYEAEIRSGRVNWQPQARAGSSGASKLSRESLSKVTDKMGGLSTIEEKSENATSGERVTSAAESHGQSKKTSDGGSKETSSRDAKSSKKQGTDDDFELLGDEDDESSSFVTIEGQVFGPGSSRNPSLLSLDSVSSSTATGGKTAGGKTAGSQRSSSSSGVGTLSKTSGSVSSQVGHPTSASSSSSSSGRSSSGSSRSQAGSSAGSRLSGDSRTPSGETKKGQQPVVCRLCKTDVSLRNFHLEKMAHLYYFN